MCGITGFVDPGGRVDQPETVLRRMCDELAHRGPDDQGSFIGDGAALGHRRLSIIDLEGGRQPISNEDGSVVIVLNGEIYNFQTLRQELLGKGHVFQTNSDTEALVHLYEEKGRELLGDLVGMFALAIWDRKRKKLLLARDRMGQKPLYYQAGPKGLVFGSELRALMQHPAVERSVDLPSLSKYLLYDSVPAPGSILKGVRKLEPGGWLEYDGDTVETGRYWDLPFAHPGVEALNLDLPDDDDALASLLWERMLESTRLRLMSDVPLGVFLSGGIDSSAIVALMAELLPPERIKTFAVGFENKSFDESSYARDVARHFGTDHHEETLDPQVMIDLLPDILGSMSEPLADGSVVPTYLLSRFARKHVTVALGGDGGDELFLGYPTFLAHRAARLAGVLPQSLYRKVLRPAASLLPVSTDNISFDFKVKRFLEGMGYPRDERHIVWVMGMAPERQQRILSSDVLSAISGQDPFEDVARYQERCSPRDDYDRLSYLYAKLYMQDDILVKVDRASMAHGLEVRAPFLDHRVVELICAMPTKMKLRGRTMKYLLKHMLKGRVPEHVTTRPKKGFGMPVAEWLKGPLRPLVEELLSESELRKDGLFDPKGVRALIDQHQKGRADNRKPIWSLLAFRLWQKRYL